MGEGESLLKIQNVAVKEADAERTSIALETQTSAMQQEVKELRLSKETLGHQVKALTAEMRGHHDVLEGLKMERTEIETQLKRSEDNIHESIQIKERLISELEHVEKQAANEQIWHQKIELELAHSDKLRHSEDMLASQMHRVTKRAPSRGRSSQQSASRTQMQAQLDALESSRHQSR